MRSMKENNVACTHVSSFVAWQALLLVSSVSHVMDITTHES